ncbi:hypothetical protein ACFFIY_01795 [Bhargavaea ullalensis]|uniref:Membrane protein n=1 Tax=Bhargavaea ullalensis TaxID=1265685 RepID=A0ABV2GAB8_9BACL
MSLRNAKVSRGLLIWVRLAVPGALIVADNAKRWTATLHEFTHPVNALTHGVYDSTHLVNALTHSLNDSTHPGQHLDCVQEL